MINLFQFAAQDKSLYYLSQVFGSMNGVIFTPGGASGASSGGALTLLGTMFKVFNSVVLAIGALMVVYVTVVGVMMTAHEGEFMGKKWNNIWIPIRTVLGIAALVPTGSGYSAIQIIMMWIIVQGIGAADTLWNTVLAYVNVVGSPYTQITLPSSQVVTSLRQLFQSLTCDATARISANPSWLPQGGGYYCGSTSGGFCGSQSTVSYTSGSYSMGPSGACGTLNYCNTTTACATPGSLACAACQAQISAIQNIITTLSGIASQFAQADYNYRSFYYNSYNQPGGGAADWINSYCSAQGIPSNQCCIASNPSPFAAQQQACTAAPGNSNFPDPNNNGYVQNPSNEAVNNLYWPYALQPSLGNTDFIMTATGYYMNLANAAVTTFIAQQANTKMSGPLGDAQNAGWLLAGGYYYTVAQMNNNNFTNAMPVLQVVLPTISSGVMNGFRNNYTAADVLAGAAAAAGQPNQGSLGSTPTLSGYSAILSSTTGTLNQVSQTTYSGNSGSNPLSQVQTAGMSLLIAAEVLFAVLVAVTIAYGIAGNIDVWVLGTGVVDPAGPALTLAYFLLVPMFFGLMAIMISIGGLLGVYVPLIPYIVFTFGAIGWFLSTFEAMVAGPLVALGILSPSGHHEILGKAEPALMLMFNVFLRPSLMIFGLIAGMLLSVVVISMINSVFWTIVFNTIFNMPGAPISNNNTAIVSAVGNPLETIIFLSAYVMLIVAALNKCFAAIYIIPQQVMRWIGGQGDQYGEAEALGGIKEGVTHTATRAGGVASGAGDYGTSAASKSEKAREGQRQVADITKKGAPSATPKKEP